MRKRIRHLKEHGVRTALSRMHLGLSVQRLLLPLNVLLKQFDKKMMATLGVEHSNLHERLWECTHQVWPRMQTGSDQSGLLVAIGIG